MRVRTIALSALVSSLMLLSNLALAADQDQVQDQTRDQTQLRDQDRIYGSQLMTEQERQEHRAQMRSFKTQQERDAYQLEHHKRMQVRAKEKGVVLPDEPMMKPGGRGPGGGMGGGMRPGGY